MSWEEYTSRGNDDGGSEFSMVMISNNNDDIFDNDDGEDGKDGEDDELLARLHLLWFEVVWQASWVWGKEGVVEGDLELSVVHVLVF